MTFIVQSYFHTLLRYAVTFCGAVVLKGMDQKTLVSADEVVRCVKLCIYTHLESLQTRVHKSLIYIGNLARHSFPLFGRNKTQPQTSKTSEQRLAYH